MVEIAYLKRLKTYHISFLTFNIHIRSLRGLMSCKFSDYFTTVIFLICFHNFSYFGRNIHTPLARFLHLFKFKNQLFIITLGRCL
jgi:hypothetical protein